MRETVFIDNEEGTCVQRRVASIDATNALLRADHGMLDGISAWYWFRLPNGDCVFGCYPQGSTYEEFEKEMP